MLAPSKLCLRSILVSMVLVSASTAWAQEPDAGSKPEQDAGTAPEQEAQELDETELTIHAMPLRPTFQTYLTGDHT